MGLSSGGKVPALSIVILLNDRAEHALTCLDSIYMHPVGMGLEVILVDNSSQNSTISRIRESYPEARIYSAPQNQNTPRNYNLGIRQALGKYILLLDQNAVVHPGTITSMVKAMRSHPDYGVVGPQLHSKSWKLMPGCVRALPTPWRYIARQVLLDSDLPLGKVWETLHRWALIWRFSGAVPCISKDCMLTKNSALERVGLFDEDYEIFFEVEWCHRVQKLGYRVAYSAGSKLSKVGDDRIYPAGEQSKQSEYINALRYFDQYHQLTHNQHWLIWMATLLGLIMRTMLSAMVETFTRKPANAHMYQSLTRWILLQIPSRAGRAGMDTTTPFLYEIREGK